MKWVHVRDNWPAFLEAIIEKWPEADEAEIPTFLMLRRLLILAWIGSHAETDLARELGMSEQALRVAIHRFRQRYGEVLRQTVKATLGPDESVEDEIACLMAAFR